MAMVDQEHASVEAERLNPGEVLLLPQPAFLAGIAVAFSDIAAGVGRSDKDSLVSTVEALSREHAAIGNLLAKVVGLGKMRLVDNDLQNIFGGIMDISSVDLGVLGIPGFQSVRFPAKFEKANIWVRDVLCRFGKLTFVNSAHFPNGIAGEGIMASAFGEGGRLICAGKAILVDEELWRRRKADAGYALLVDAGFKIAPLRHIDRANRPLFSDHAHIDKSMALVENDARDLMLAVGKSYTRQGNGTRKQIRLAAETIGAEVVEIEDSDFVPYAFNLIQLRDGSVVMSSGADALADALSQFLGENKVFETDEPIALLPTLAGGGIRCLTNIVDMKTLLRICEI